LLTFFGPRFWLAGKEYGYVTPPELLTNRYQTSWAGALAALISLIMLIPYSAVQLMGIGILVEGLTDGRIPYMGGVFLMAIFSGFTALWAGMRSVSWTDAFQALTMIVTSLVALFYVFFQFFGSPISFFTEVTLKRPELLELSWSPEVFIGLTLPWAFFALTNPQVSQRMFVPNRLSSLRRMIIYFAGFGFLYTIISTLFGFQAALIAPGLEDPDKAMSVLLTRIPTPMALILLVGIFAAATSTLGSITLTLSSLVSRDIIKPLTPGIAEDRELSIGKITIPALLIVYLIFAWQRPGLIAILSSMASGGLLVMAPPLIGAFVWREGTGPAAVASMALGGLITLLMYGFDFYPLGWWPSVWGIGISTALFVGISMITEPPGRAEDFLGEIDRRLKEHSVT
ncbi:MAG: sodium:solute symporter family protein, partial [Candidatus Bipolaricaulota bacterium]